MLSSDCGFGRQGVPRPIAFYKAAALAQGANIVREELGVRDDRGPCRRPGAPDRRPLLPRRRSRPRARGCTVRPLGAHQCSRARIELATLRRARDTLRGRKRHVVSPQFPESRRAGVVATCLEGLASWCIRYLSVGMTWRGGTLRALSNATDASGRPTRLAVLGGCDVKASKDSFRYRSHPSAYAAMS